MNKVRKQHYVWRHYLKPWSTKEKIWCLRDGKIFNSNLMGIAQERDFYKIERLSQQEINCIKVLTSKSSSEIDAILNEGWIETFQMGFKCKDIVDKLGVDDDEINEFIDTLIHNNEENFHAFIEGKSIKYLDSLLNLDSSFYLDPDESLGFFHYIALQYMRTKKIKNDVCERVKSIGPVVFENIWPILRHIYSTNLAGSLYIQRAEYRLVFMKNQTLSPLFTGDQPIVNTHAINCKLGEEAKELEFYYPLSKDLAILVTNDKKYKEMHSYLMNYDDVHNYNELISSFSHEQIYSVCKHSLDHYVGNR